MYPQVHYMAIILSNSSILPITVLFFDTFIGRLEKFVLRRISFYYSTYIKTNNN